MTLPFAFAEYQILREHVISSILILAGIVMCTLPQFVL